MLLTSQWGIAMPGKAGSGKRKKGAPAPQGAAAPVRAGQVDVHLANVACTLLILGDALFPRRGS